MLSRLHTHTHHAVLGVARSKLGGLNARWAIVALAVVTCVGGTLASSALAAAPFTRQLDLAPSEVEPNADGKARIFVGPNRETLDITAHRLSADAVYKVFVDGSELGSITTDANGDLTVRFSRTPTGSDLPLPAFVDLENIHLVELRNAAGQVVLSGS